MERWQTHHFIVSPTNALPNRAERSSEQLLCLIAVLSLSTHAQRFRVQLAVQQSKHLIHLTTHEQSQPA